VIVLLKKIESILNILASLETISKGIISLGALVVVVIAAFRGLLSNEVSIPLWVLTLLVLTVLLFLVDFAFRFRKNIKLSRFHHYLLGEFAENDRLLKQSEIYSLLTPKLENPAILKIISDLRVGGYIKRKNSFGKIVDDIFYLTDKGINVAAKDSIERAEKKRIKDITDSLG